jgi:putative transposase
MALRYSWTIEAWCVLSDHYHFIARSPPNASVLSQFIRTNHSTTARYVNKIDKKPGRKVWWNYWDTCITYEKSYFARLRYIHLNALKHGFVENPEEYLHSSYSWFIDKSTAVMKNLVLTAPIDQLDVEF